MLIIFDLDQTLVDSSAVETLRAAKKWSQVMARVHQLAPYEGITALLNSLNDSGHVIAIVTRSPDMIAKAIVKQHKWPIKIIVGYHQVNARKPDPEGLLLAMATANTNSQNTIHIGDQAEDTEASRAAAVMAIGASWGLANSDLLKASLPDQVFSSVGELAAFLRKAL